MRLSTRPLWILRVLWALLGVVAVPAFAGALDGRGAPVQVVAASGLWAGWAAVLVATLVPSPPSLTVVRLLTPGAPAAALAAAVAGSGAVAATAAVGLGSVAAIVAATAEVGGVFVQAGGYRDESRFLLRPPGGPVGGPLGAAGIILAA